MNELATVGLHASLSVGQGAGAGRGAVDAPRQLAREFDAMVLRLLWRTTAVPGPRSAQPARAALGATLGDFFAPQMAAQHSAGFGALMLAALDPGPGPQPRRN